jgi:hypothetical protein
VSKTNLKKNIFFFLLLEQEEYLLLLETIEQPQPEGKGTTKHQTPDIAQATASKMSPQRQ